MAINKNHEFEELNGIKCAIVEKNITQPRVDFLKRLLEFNRYTVVVVPSPPPKAVAPAPTTDTDATTLPAPEPGPETFTLGVTDVSFNPINAIFGRLLKTPGNHVVTLAFWHQKESESHDEVPYYETK